jgi:two-component system chemotaxis sensor kinase CheA
LSEFVAEANEILEALGRELLTLDAARGQEIDPDTLNAVFRAAHSLKGLSAMFGQERLSRLAHHAEDLLDALRLGKAPLDDVALDLLVETLDVLQALLVESAQGEASQDLEVRAETMGERLRGVAAGSSVGAVDVLEQVGIDPGLRAVFTEYEEHRLRENVKKGVGLWKVRAVYQLSDFDTRLAALNQVLKALGEVVSTLPSSQPGGDDTIAFDLVFGSGKPRDAILSALAGEATLEPLTTRALPPAAPPTSSPRKLPLPARSAPPLLRAVAPGEEAPLLAPGGFRGSEPSLRSLTQTVRVDIGRLDGLMNSIGELLLIRGNIQRLAEVARQTGAVALPKLWAQELQREARALERKLDELQKGVLEVRMVPLVQVFDKLTRLMRRLVRDSGKDVEFEVSGGDVELDKLIVEELSDPLMHLLRNALDHGVEAPEAREKVGKPRRAKIRMRAQQQGNHVSIEVGDDGAGMDEARIRQVAVERGVVTLEQTEEMERRELLNLVFLPGFSTREDVSELSGRGVGLDVVKTNLQRLSGLIDVQSRRHEGSSFVLTLPLTLAIIRALMVQVSGRTYAVPLNSVLETLAVKTSELRTVERREVFTLRGQTLPFVRLSRLFKLEEAPLERHLVVIIGLAQQRFGLAVDALLGQQDIVTKPLGGRLSRIPGVAGATELGDRRAVLVLDVSTLMEELLRPSAAAG